MDEEVELDLLQDLAGIEGHERIKNIGYSDSEIMLVYNSVNIWPTMDMVMVVM